MKVGLAQFNIIWENKEKNKVKCLSLLKQACKNKVDLVLFPEMSLTGFSMAIDKIGEDNNETVNWFSQAAQNFGLHIGFGFVEKRDEKGKNNFFIVSPDGKVISKYTKIHPFSFSNEHKFFWSGSDIAITRINDFSIASFICYDLRFPEIFQIASQTAQVIAIIANWPKVRREHWITLLKARAIENQCYIIGVNRVGKGDGILYSGDSMIVDPNGSILVTEFMKESLICFDLDVNRVDELRSSFTLKKDRKKDLYYALLMGEGNE